MEENKLKLENAFSNFLNKSFVIAFLATHLAKKAGVSIDETNYFLEEKLSNQIVDKEEVLLCSSCLSEITDQKTEECYKCGSALYKGEENFITRWKINYKKLY